MQSIIQDDIDVCYLCGGVPTDKHHCLRGRLRKLADIFGLYIHVCRRCHERVHEDEELENFLKQEAQRAYEKEHGHEDYMKKFGRNYL